MNTKLYTMALAIITLGAQGQVMPDAPITIRPMLPASLSYKPCVAYGTGEFHVWAGDRHVYSFVQTKTYKTFFFRLETSWAVTNGLRHCHIFSGQRVNDLSVTVREFDAPANATNFVMTIDPQVDMWYLRQ